MVAESSNRPTLQITPELHSTIQSVAIKAGVSMLSVVEFLLYNKSEDSIVEEMQASDYKPRRVGRPKKAFHSSISN